MNKTSRLLIVTSLALSAGFLTYYSALNQPESVSNEQHEHADEAKIILDEVLASNSSEAQGQERTISPNELSSLINKAEADDEGFEHFINTKPSSLRDVPPPSPLEFDENGLLISNARLRSLFEYYLSSLGEEPLERVVIRIKFELESQLQGDNLATGIRILEGYLQYRNHLGILKNDYANNHPDSSYSLEAVKYMREQAQETRQAFFDADTITGFFSREDQYEDYMLAKAEVNADAQLSTQEKHDLLTEIESNKPEWINALNAASRKLEKTRQTLSTLEQNSASDEEIRELVTSTYDEEAAARFLKLQAERKAWADRLQAYRTELNALINDQDLSQLDQDYIHELRSIFFSENEIVRVQSLDKIDLNI